MTFSAIHRNSGKRLNLADVLNPKTIPDWKDYVCPITGDPVTPVESHKRKGSIVRSHWRTSNTQERHWPDDIIFDSEYAYIKEGTQKIKIRESIEHIEGKKIVYDDISFFDGFLEKQYCSFEEKIRIESKGKFRIADVACILPYGGITVIEVQVSPINLQDFTERTEDYLFSGVVNVFWVFDEKILTPQIADRCYEVTGDIPYTFRFTKELDSKVLSLD